MENICVIGTHDVSSCTVCIELYRCKQCVNEIKEKKLLSVVYMPGQVILNVHREV